MKRKNPRRERAQIIKTIAPQITHDLNLTPTAGRFHAKQRAQGIIAARRKSA